MNETVTAMTVFDGPTFGSTFYEDNNIYQTWPCYPGYPSNPIYYPVLWYQTPAQPPQECSGDVHVFPCAKCGECKCGKAKLAKETP
jgi:hypothetical protein